MAFCGGLLTRLPQFVSQSDRGILSASRPTPSCGRPLPTQPPHFVSQFLSSGQLFVAQALSLWSRVLTQPAPLRFVIQWCGWTPTTGHFVSQSASSATLSASNQGLQPVLAGPSPSLRSSFRSSFLVGSFSWHRPSACGRPGCHPASPLCFAIEWWGWTPSSAPVAHDRPLRFAICFSKARSPLQTIAVSPCPPQHLAQSTHSLQWET